MREKIKCVPKISFNTPIQQFENPPSIYISPDFSNPEARWGF